MNAPANTTPLVSGLGQCSLDYIASVDGFPEENDKKEALDMTIQGGGPVATALVSLARLGVRTSFQGVVSDDRAGVEIAEGLESEGVDTSGLKVAEGGRSQTAFIIVNRSNASRTILWQRPTAGRLSPEDVDTRAITGSSFLLLDGLMMEASIRAAEAARGAGVPVMLDAGSVREGTLELAQLCDYVVASEKFSRTLESSPRDSLRRLTELGVKTSTVTLGERGSVTSTGDRVFSTPAPGVDAVDTTGAGDVFHGGYIYGLLQGWDLEKTVRFASAFAALKCTRPGGRTGIPTLAEALELMDRP